MSKKPPYRKLRGYAFDPSLSLQLDTFQVNNIVYKVEWEDLETVDLVDSSGNKAQRILPSGEYIEIIDYDPASGGFYEPVDLNELYLLAQDGLEPSVSNPQFHQQMVYAVVMTTIKNFEKAIGRKIYWSKRIYLKDENGKKEIVSEFVEKLRIYPHALRQANAYYNPQKKALLFGYFPAQTSNADLQINSGNVFTCLSHDIIAHETTHAILDGLHRKFIEGTHPDTRAFHEAFADIVALFQHFTFPEVLKHQIAKTRGDLGSQNLLGELAQEFGKAMGNYGGLRDAIGGKNSKTGKWVAHVPNPEDYKTKMEFHDRGAILVATIFDAFLNIYKNQIRRILRVATNGTGVLPLGDLHPDLVNLLANQAAEASRRILKICVRALDYCPPLDINFGDYLRAIITADIDLVEDDERNYRIAIIEAFQKRGIVPIGIKSMSLETIAYPNNNDLGLDDVTKIVFFDFLRQFKEAVSYQSNRKIISDITQEFITGGERTHLGLHQRISEKFLHDNRSSFERLTGLIFENSEEGCKEQGFDYSTKTNTAKYTIENLWLTSRISPNEKIVNHVIVSITQKRGVICEMEKGVFKVKSFYQPSNPILEKGALIFRGGCTLIFDLDNMKLKYVIKKEIDSLLRMEQQFQYKESLFSSGASVSYFDNEDLTSLSGPFAFMHSFNHNH